MRKLVFVGVLALLAASTTAAAQQATAEFRGSVVDEQGLALPGVTIVATNEDTGIFREAVSNADGSFFMPALTPGTYEVTAELPGFRGYVRQGVPLGVGQSRTVEIPLQLGALEETITVTAETPLVDTTSKEVGGYIQNQELVDTPSFNRNFTGYLDLVPGVVASGSTASFAADSISVNGMDSSNVAYNFDGASNDDDHLGGSAGAQARIPLEAVQEFQLLTGQFDAEFGLASGGVLNAVSKSATNQFHGSAFGFFKDAALTAEDFFVNTQDLDKPETKEQQYGFTVGGPVVQDKLHFFWSIERPILDSGVTVNVPARPEFNRAEIEAIRPWNYFARGDHQINASNTWGGRWLYETSPSTHFDNDWAPGVDEFEGDVDWAAGGSLNSVLGNNRVNVLRIGAVYEDLNWESREEGFEGVSQIDQAPRLDFLTYTDGTIDTSFQRINLTWSLDNQFSWFVPDKKGDHDFKFGFQYRYLDLDYRSSNDLNGTFTFDTDLGFDATNPSTYPERLNIQVGDNLYDLNAYIISGFMQDKWQINDRATLSLGVRYDLEAMETPNQDNPFYNGPGGTGSSDYPVDKNNFAPRMGFSYVLDDAGETVLRGGVGRFYQKFRMTHLDNLYGQQRFTNTFSRAFPLDGIDPGPSNGQLPTDPFLAGGPVVNRTLLNQLFPPGSTQLNQGNIRFDSADRENPYADQFSFGVERQLASNMSLSVDYIRIQNRDQMVLFNWNQPERTGTSRSDSFTRPDARFVDDVYQLSNAGSIDHDALQVQFDKRFSNNYRFRLSYTLGHTRGNTRQGDAQDVRTQVGQELNLDLNEGPTDFDRRHNLVLNGTWAVPNTGGLRLSGIMRTRSGTRFSLIDSRSDLNRNGNFNDEWLPAGTYSGEGENAYTVDFDGGRNGAIGPEFVQFDMRGGYNFELPNQTTFEVYVDVINLTNRSNFNAPSGDLRRSSRFLILRSLVNNGLPRTAQIGLRYAF